MFYYNDMKKISTFAEKLKIIMDLNSVSANALADALNINKSIISRYLSGKMLPRQNRLDEIAVYFNVSHAWLMGYDCEMYNDSVKSQIIKSLDSLNNEQLMEIYSFIKKLLEEKQ